MQNISSKSVGDFCAVLLTNVTYADKTTRTHALPHRYRS